MNPTDQARKEARRKELKKNKKQRQVVRVATLKGKNPRENTMMRICPRSSGEGWKERRSWESVWWHQWWKVFGALPGDLQPCQAFKASGSTWW